MCFRRRLCYAPVTFRLVTKLWGLALDLDEIIDDWCSPVKEAVMMKMWTATTQNEISGEADRWRSPVVWVGLALRLCDGWWVSVMRSREDTQRRRSTVCGGSGDTCVRLDEDRDTWCRFSKCWWISFVRNRLWHSSLCWCCPFVLWALVLFVWIKGFALYFQALGL